MPPAMPWPGGPVLGACCGGGAAAAGLLVSAHTHPYPWSVWLLVQAVGISFVVAGVIAWLRQPGNGTGRLMTAVGTTWYIGFMQLSTHPVLYAVGFCLFYVTGAVFAHLILALPTGRLPGRAERLVAAGLYAVSITQVLRYLQERPAHPQVWGASAGASMWASVGSFSGATLTIVMFWLVLRRWRAAGKPSRRAFDALWSTGAAVGLIILAWTGTTLYKSSFEVQRAMLVAFTLPLILTPFAILAGLLRVRLARIGVANLVVRLEGSTEPMRLRDGLADALGDATLQVCYHLPADGYVDADGHPVEVPSNDDRAVTLVERRGERLAVLVHDPALTDQAPLVDAVVAAARLALENSRLHAAQLEDIRASRARIVAAADRERHRIQRDLHDGAQHNLLAISLLLGQVREELAACDHGQGVAGLLAKAAIHLHDVIRDLRELTEGIDPPALAEQGLAAVVETLAERAPLPVIFNIPPRRWAAHIERAAYFVINEALANVYKHAHASRAVVSVDATEQTLSVRIVDDGDGGADPEQGGGLRGLRDRVATVGGTLDIHSRPGAGTCIKAELPCA